MDIDSHHHHCQHNRVNYPEQALTIEFEISTVNRQLVEIISRAFN